MRHFIRDVVLLSGAVLAFAACRSGKGNAPGAGSTAAPEAPSAAAPQAKLDKLTRADFNRGAIELNQPLFWRSDANGNGGLDADEMVVVFNHEGKTRQDFLAGEHEFTAQFRDLYSAMRRPATAPADASGDEKARREAVRLELAQGRPTLIESDFAAAPGGEKALVHHLWRAAVFIERLYEGQKGTLDLETKLPADDTASAGLFFRNQGPFCVAPKTEKDPSCNALPERPKPVFGLYPAAVQADKNFCETLEKQPNGKELLDHFSVVVEGSTPGTFKAVKYSAAYPQDMAEVAGELEAATIGLGADEGALQNYLKAAAQAFRDDDWERADEAWAAMAGKSKYYLRVAPDEVYYEPCAWKAGFALTFARIDAQSTEWREKLEPIKQDMENDVAKLAGGPYRARDVNFKLPDFIDVVLNAGDARAPFGATVGQSLPNWGRIAERGGRTVTMANLYNDADSQKLLMDQMSSLYCQSTMAKASADPNLANMGVVLHEAAHNLGPAHDYTVDGKVDHAAFGGALAATLEELKAQTAALYFPAKLVEKKLVGADEAEKADVREIAWALGNVALGMYDAERKPKNYSQLASIQLGRLREAGVFEWKPNETAANGTDQGCFDLYLDRFHAAASKLLADVLAIKSKGDRAAAERLKKRWVDDDDEWKKLRDVIAERWLRATRASFLYSVRGL
jgi:hypothetical protein